MTSPPGPTHAAAGSRCGYHVDGFRRCRELAVVTARIGEQDVPLCEQHKRPKFHPPDLHKRLREARRLT